MLNQNSSIINHKEKFSIIAVAAVVFTTFLYGVDTDPAYPDLLKTLIEFSINTGIIFGLFSVIYLSSSFVGRRYSKVAQNT